VKKGGFVILVYSIIGTLVGCLNCPEVPYPYYDFKGISLEYQNETIITNQPFVMSINESLIENVAKLNIGFFTSSLAIEKCTENGELGRKYYITNIQVVSNNDWDSEHPAGSLLNDIVLYETITRSNTGAINGSVYSKTLSEMNFFPNDVGEINLKFGTPPLSKTHEFTILAIKSNKDSLSATTQNIVWK